MGAIAPSKVPKLIKKRDGNEPVKVFKQGGKVKKFGLGGILVPVDPITQQAIPKNIQQSKFYDPVGTKMGFDTERNKIKDVNEAEQEAAMQADINRRWKNGGKVSKAAGKQFVAQPKSIARKTAGYR